MIRPTYLILMGIFIGIGVVASATYAIPQEQLDVKKIYYGNPEDFEKPAAVNMDEIIKASPEYEEIKKKKIERGTGKYWILLSKATDRCIAAVTDIAEESDYDLIAAKGYLNNLEPSIPSEDITETVVAYVEDN